ncbi:DUF262 domain-containing protein [Bradyrhizobium sp. TZ2]
MFKKKLKLEDELSVKMSLVEAHERTIGQLFSDAFSFEIPSYQRPYAWEKEQADELLSDLIYAMDNSGTSGGMCFLGSIVLIKAPSVPLSKVVDGQQRLTTLTIPPQCSERSDGERGNPAESGKLRISEGQS